MAPTTRDFIRASAAALSALCWATPVQAQTDEWFASDKALHFGASAVISAGSYAIAAKLYDCRRGRAAVGGATALVAGVGKELIDRSGGGVASWKDLVWDLLGAATGVTIAALIDGPDTCGPNERGDGARASLAPSRLVTLSRPPAAAMFFQPFESSTLSPPPAPGTTRRRPPPYASRWFVSWF